MKRIEKKIADAKRAASRAASRVDSAAEPPPFAEYRGRPVEFAAEALGLTLWSHQRRALEAIEQHRRVAWRTAHAVGKSTVAVAAACYWVCVYPGALALLTAPTYRQVSLVLWRGLQRVHRAAPRPLGGELFEVPERGWRLSTGAAVVGFAAGSPEQLAGLHAERVLFVVDEASGIEPALFEAIKGSLVGDSRLLLFGNPTQTSGEFFNAFHTKQSLYHPLHTSALDVPNVSGAEPAIPGLVDREWVAEAALDFGDESAAFAVRALGEFPRQSADAVISIGMVEVAKERWLQMQKAAGPMLGALEVGVDVARFGDDESVLVARRGAFMYEPIALRGADAVTVAEKVVQLVTDRLRGFERAIVRVDTTGVGGGVADLLRRIAGKLMDVVDVNAGAAAASPRYARVRDELLFTLRDWIRNGGALPPDTRLEGELLAPTYSFTPGQKILVESKDETKKRIKRSPDRMDAAALAVYSLGPVEQGEIEWIGGFRSWARKPSPPERERGPSRDPLLIQPPEEVAPLARRWRVLRGGVYVDLRGGWSPITTGTIVEVGEGGWTRDAFARLRQSIAVEAIDEGDGGRQ